MWCAQHGQQGRWGFQARGIVGKCVIFILLCNAGKLLQDLLRGLVDKRVSPVVLHRVGAYQCHIGGPFVPCIVRHIVNFLLDRCPVHGVCNNIIIIRHVVHGHRQEEPFCFVETGVSA